MNGAQVYHRLWIFFEYRFPHLSVAMGYRLVKVALSLTAVNPYCVRLGRYFHRKMVERW